MQAEGEVVVQVVVQQPEAQPEPNLTLPEEFPTGDLFTWHGAELIFIPIMMVVGVIGNLLVFYIYHFRWRTNTVTLYKRMLAVLDLCNVVLALPPLLYITIHPDDPSFYSLCAFTSFIALGTAIASGGVLVIIAVDRFLKLCLLRKTGVGSLFSKQLFAVSVAVAVVINVPTVWIFGRDTVHFPQHHVTVSYCFIRTESKSGGLFLGWGAVLALVFLSITVSLVYLYWCVVRRLRDLSDKHDELKRRPSVGVAKEAVVKQKQSELMRRSCLVFISVTVVFFVTYLPYFVTLVLSMVTPDLGRDMSPALKALYDLAKLSPLLNAVSNPFIYSFTSDNFRKEVIKLATCRACLGNDLFRRRAFSFGSTNTINKAHELSSVSN
ncbi:hypothetical protein EGW08_002504 [Elysia chlorotica]|uniref:G-protein coupled receptors family 1 profile domain-containing protein n=1 Tax=Elysia chlorotica TaxID=188477 RepID=A0A3S1BRC8_ELYCH|nr:hypothetical protein EGW08_002504 [Elysia chlorotica]